MDRDIAVNGVNDDVVLASDEDQVADNDDIFNVEDVNVEFGDEVEPPFEQFEEYYDDDQFISYSPEQLSFEILGLLSKKDVNIGGKSRWGRRVDQFIRLLTTHVKFDHEKHLIPVLAANRILIDTDVAEDDDAKGIAMRDYLRERCHNYNLKEPYINALPKIINVEKSWEANLSYKGFVVKRLVEKNSIAISHNVFTNEEVHIIPITGSVNGQKSEEVQVAGFAFLVHDTITPKNTVVFDPNKYLSALKSLVVNDQVVVFDESGNKHSCIVADVNDTTLKVLKEGGGSINYDLTLEAVLKARLYIHPVTTNENHMFHISLFATMNVVFALLEGDTDFRKTLTMVMPSIPDILRLHSNDMKNVLCLEDFKDILARYNVTVQNIPKEAYPIFRDILQMNIASIVADKVTRDKTKLVIPKLTRQFDKKNSYDILNFSKNENVLKALYNDYKFKNKFADSEYHRMKYLTKHRDCAQAFFVSLIGELNDTVYNRLTKIMPHILEEKDTLEASLKDLKAKQEDAECKDAEHDIKKTYTLLSELESDNFKEVPGVAVGDFVLLKRGSNTTLYKRIQTGSGDQLYVKQSGGIEQKCEGGDDAAHLEKSKCVYDDASHLCQKKEVLRMKYKQTCLQKRLEILKNAIQFHTHYDIAKRTALADIEALKQIIDYHPVSYSHILEGNLSVDVDYSEYVGNAADVDLNIFEAEQLDGVYYNVIGPKEANVDGREDLDADADLDSTQQMIKDVAKFVGVELGKGEIDYIYNNIKASNSREPVERAIQAQRDVLDANRRKMLAEASKRKATREALKELDAKLRQKQTEMMSKNERNLKSEYYKKSLVIIAGLLILYIQSNLPNVKIVSGYGACSGYGLEGYPLNEKQNNTLMRYISCVLRQIGGKDSEMYGLIKSMTDVQVQEAIKTYIDGVMAQRPEIRTMLDETNRRLQDKSGKTIEKSYEEWPSFKPQREFSGDARLTDHTKILKLMMDTVNAKEYVKHDVKIGVRKNRVQFMKKLDKELDAMSYFEDSDDIRSLFVKVGKKSSNIIRSFYVPMHFDDNLFAVKRDLFAEKEITQPLGHTLMFTMGDLKQRENASEHAQMSPAEMFANAIANAENEAFWTDFSTNVYNKYDLLFEKLGVDNDIAEKFGSIVLNFSAYTDVVKVKNVYRSFLFSTVKTWLAKLVKRWKIREERHLKSLIKDGDSNALEKAHLNLEPLIELSAKVESNVSLREFLTGKVVEISSLLKHSKPYEMSSRSDILVKRNVYLYNAMLAEVIYDLLKFCHTNSDKYNIITINSFNDEETPETHKVIRDIVLAMLKGLLDRFSKGIYNVDSINDKREEFREERKTNILTKMKKMSDEQKKLVKVLHDLGMLEWEDLPDVDLDQVKEKAPDDVFVNEKKKGDAPEGDADANADEVDYDQEEGMYPGENDDGDNDDMEDLDYARDDD
jgi:hypothetical protein